MGKKQGREETTWALKCARFWDKTLILRRQEHRGTIDRQGSPISHNREAKPLPWLLSRRSQEGVYTHTLMYVLYMYVWAQQD